MSRRTRPSWRSDTDHKERRQYIEKNGEAILLDLHSLVLAHKAWFEYQALRAGRARLSAGADPSEEKLLERSSTTPETEYDQVVEEMTTVLDTLNRELWILAELPGKRTIPFTGAHRSAREVARMAEQLLTAVERLSDSVRQQPAPLEHPNTATSTRPSDSTKTSASSAGIWTPDEHLDAIATASEGGVGGALAGFPSQ